MGTARFVLPSPGPNPAAPFWTVFITNLGATGTSITGSLCGIDPTGVDVCDPDGALRYLFTPANGILPMFYPPFFPYFWGFSDVGRGHIQMQLCQ
jgi:hypothetical protein